jgi:hypothetical protein
MAAWTDWNTAETPPHLNYCCVVDRLDLSIDRAKVQQHLGQELSGQRLSRAERESLLRDGMHGNLRYRMRALMSLSAEAQFRMALVFAALDDAEAKFNQRISALGSISDSGSLTEFFARAAGYIPAATGALALPLLPTDPHVLAYDLMILTERTSKGTGLARKRANQIARDLLRWRKRRHIIPVEEYERPLSLQRIVFNTRLAQELRLAGQTPRSLHLLLAATGVGLDVHKIIDQVFSLYQTRPILHDIDTMNICLSLLRAEIGERLALDYWKTFRPSSKRRMVHRLTRPSRVAAEARRQGTAKALRATVEMFLRSIGWRDHESPEQRHEDLFGDVLQSMGVAPSPRLWDRLLSCRETFHGCLSIVELQKRKARWSLVPVGRITFYLLDSNDPANPPESLQCSFGLRLPDGITRRRVIMNDMRMAHDNRQEIVNVVQSFRSGPIDTFWLLRSPTVLIPC